MISYWFALYFSDITVVCTVSIIRIFKTLQITAKTDYILILFFAEAFQNHVDTVKGRNEKAVFNIDDVSKPFPPIES